MRSIEELLTQSDGIADRLRALREASGMSGKQLADRLGWYPSKVSRLERGRTKPSATDIRAWVDHCGGSAQQERELLDLLGQLDAAHREWRRRLRSGHAAVQRDYDERIAAVARMRNFETAFVPGMLQTPAYARHVFQEMRRLHSLSDDNLDQAVAARLRRQQHLYDVSKSFEFLIAEPVLRWGVCPSDVMRAQLDRLRSATALPNTRFGVLPLGVPLSITPQNSFAIYDELTIVDSFTAETVCGEEESALYSRVFDLLWEKAIQGEAARDLIAEVMDHVSRS